MGQTSDPRPRASGPDLPLQRLHVWQIQAVRDVLFVAAVVALVWVGYALRAVTVPLLVALLLAYLFEPLIEWMSRHPKLPVNRARAVTLLLLTVGGAVVVVLALVVPLIVGQTTQFIGDIRDGTLRARVAQLSSYVPESYREEFASFLDVLPGASRGSGEQRPAHSTTAAEDQGSDEPAPPPAATDEHTTPSPAMTEDRVREILDEEISRLRDAVGQVQPETPDWLNLARGGADAIVKVIGSIVQIGLLAFLIPFYFFFFSISYPAVVRFGRNLIPEKNRPHTLELLAKMDRVVSGFVRGRIVISLIMGVLLAIGWMLCGVPYAIVLGLVVGIFSAVPYLGIVGIPMAVGFLFFDRLGSPDNTSLWWLWVLLWPSLVFGIVQLIEGYVLTPLIAGKVTNLDPVTLIVAVLAGGSVLGVYGMLLAIPLAACAKIIFTDVLLPRIRAWTSGEATDPLPIDDGD